MIKISTYSGIEDGEPRVIPLFNRATDAYFEKTASATLLPEVSTYIANLRPQNDVQYILINALGASEYWGSNSNADAFPEASLCHAPDGWTHNPLIDKIRFKNWAYGYPTFYNAKLYVHHRNKDPLKSVGDVELTAWHSRMKRVELVAALHKDRAAKFGGQGFWDRIQTGEYPDTSMGSRVPFDTSSITLDWDRYRKAQAGYRPGVHKHPGEAVLEVHKRDPIKGVAVTRKEYDEYMLTKANKILPDGRKVFVYNDYPRFFDISLVFIGADKTSKQLMKIAGDSRKYWFIGSGAEVAEKLGYEEPTSSEMSKVASAEPVTSKTARVVKKGEIIKDVPAPLTAKVVPALTSAEPPIPDSLLDVMSKMDMPSALSSAGALGIILRPREFQRMSLSNMGLGSLAQELQDRNCVFRSCDCEEPMSLSTSSVVPSLLRALAPLIASRSCFPEPLSDRVVVRISIGTLNNKNNPGTLPLTLLDKVASDYNGYRKAMAQLLEDIRPKLASLASTTDVTIQKLASSAKEHMFTPLTHRYLHTAYWDEVGV